MPGFLTQLEVAPELYGLVSLMLRELPVPALVCRAGLHCVAGNARLAQMLGRSTADCSGHLARLVVDPQDPAHLPVCSEVGLRHGDGTEVAAMMLALPVVHGAESATLCLFLEAPAWRNADLAAAVDEVMREDMQWFSGALLERLARRRSRVSSGAGASLRMLTPRERQVLKLVCDGCDDAHIAKELAISRNTLRNHLSNIYGKAGVNRRSEAVVWGRERGASVD